MRRSEKLEVLPPETSSETFVGSKHRLTFLVTKGGLILVCLLLFLAVAGAFMPALKADFINFDDDVYVTKNPHVVGGLSAQNLRWAFLSMNTAANWHPLTWLAHMIDCQFFGLQPWGHHLMSILMHAANAVLLFLVLNRATGARGRSLFVAAVFGLHPLRVESVAWVSERKDLISGCFWLLTMGAYVLYVEQTRIHPPKGTSELKPRHLQRAYYILALSLFVLGLMSKPMLVTLPFVLLIMDYWPLGRLNSAAELRRALKEKVPFLTLTAMACLVTYIVQQQGGAMSSSVPLMDRLSNSLISYSRYLGKQFWPANLAIFYPHPGNWPWSKTLLSGLLLVAISVVAIMAARSRPYFIAGWLWFLGTMVPVIGLVQVGDQAMADRYTYIPLIGVAIALSWGGYNLWDSLGQKANSGSNKTDGLILQGETKVQTSRNTTWLFIGAAIALVCTLVTTFRQTRYWQNSEQLFQHAIEVTRDNWLAHNNLGAFYGVHGDTEKALLNYQQSVSLKPNRADLHNNLGTALDRAGRPDEALSEYREALRLQPLYAEAHNNYGAALARQGQLEEAVREYEEAIRINPDYAEAHSNLGAAYGRQKRMVDAVREYREAVRIEPMRAEFLQNLAEGLRQSGQVEEAITTYFQAEQLAPGGAELHNNLGAALLRVGKVEEAKKEFQKAIQLDPALASARNNLGAVWSRSGHLDEAIMQFEAALRLKQNYPMAQVNFGDALSKKGDFSAAAEHYRNALEQEPSLAYAHCQYGIALLKLERRDEARIQFVEALRLQPNFTEAERQIQLLMGKANQ